MEWPNVSVREALQLGYDFLFAYTDVVLMQVLRIWLRKVGGTKMERVARGYLYLWLCLRGWKEANDGFESARGEGAFVQVIRRLGARKNGQMSTR